MVFVSTKTSRCLVGVRAVCRRTYSGCSLWRSTNYRGPPKNIKKNDEKLVRKIFVFSFRVNDAQRCLVFVCVSGASGRDISRCLFIVNARHVRHVCKVYRKGHIVS